MVNTYSFSEMILNSNFSKKKKASLIKYSQYIQSICIGGVIDRNSDYKGEGEKTIAISIASIKEVAARGGSLDECEVLNNV